MGRASVRAQIASYFAAANVAGVSTTYASRPKLIPGQAYNLGTDAGSGAVLIVHLTDGDEKRLTMGGPTSGSKFLIHQVAIEIKFQSAKVDAIAAVQDYDAVIDAFMTRFRADRTLGSTNQVPIWQAGEGSNGIKHRMTEPKQVKQLTVVNGTIRFEAFEFIGNA